MRLAVYCDYSYRLEDGVLTAQLPVSRFFGGLAPHCERLVMTGRLDPRPGAFQYPVMSADFVPLPFYSSGASPAGLLRAIPIGIIRFWRLLGRVDTAWVLGPTPQALVFAFLTLLRRRKLVLGVRQDTPKLYRHRYPQKRLVRWVANLLEAAFRLLSRWVPVVVVGPDLARNYRHAPALHAGYVSLLSEGDISRAEDPSRTYEGSELRMLSVGRLDAEKNPLLIADIFAQALQMDPRWRLDVCGSGPLSQALAQRLEQLGVADRATLHGHVANHGGLLDLFRTCHVFLHVSLTEGAPAVLLEAFATRLPVVATAVGGVPDLVGECGMLIPPQDPGAAVAALEKVVSDPELRNGLMGRAIAKVRTLTLEAESARVARFISGAEPGRRAEAAAAPQPGAAAEPLSVGHG